MMMKSLFESWRRYINEGVDSRGLPIVNRALHSFDAFDFSPQDLASRRGEIKPSIAYHQTQDPAFVLDIKEIFSKTADDWVFIAVNNAELEPRDIESLAFQEWVASKGYPANAKIVVIGSSPYPGDFSSTEWIAHDIIGHSAGRAFLESLGYPRGAGKWIEDNPWVGRMILKVHGYLVRKKVAIKKADMQFDMIYDIFASIILNDITWDEIKRAIVQGQIGLVEVEADTMEQIFNFCNEWVAQIPAGEPTVIKSW